MTEVLDAKERALLALLQEGLPLVPEPYQVLGEKIGWSEEEVISKITEWSEKKIIKRFGFVVRHHQMGYRQNAMVVWNIPDDKVDDVGFDLKKQEGVSLCYKRTRREPRWPFNLYCMIHSKEKDWTLKRIKEIKADLSLGEYETKTLIGTKQFKQTGAKYIV